MSAPRNVGRPPRARDLDGKCTRVSLPDARRAAAAMSARAIRRTRRVAGVAVSELAAACSVSTSTAHAWETGRVDISVGRLRQIATALGVPLGHLTG